jgi:hypothetical protein
VTYTNTKHPHVPAAFINAIREEGTKKEACDFLQAQWNETFALTAQLTAALAAVEQARDDGHAQGLRDAANKLKSEFNIVGIEVEGRTIYGCDLTTAIVCWKTILALIPAEPTPAATGTTKGGTE